MNIFLDTQTTGLKKTDKILSIGILTQDTEIYNLVNEGKKIPPLASSINHITNEMIKTSPPLSKSEAMAYLKNNNSESNVIIGHNIGFDLLKLSEYNFLFKGEIIDTMRVVKHLIPECEIFSLQYLRYELKLYKEASTTLTPHHALHNAKLTKILYEYLLEIESTQNMIELSKKNVLLDKFTFGKYSGRYIEEIAMNDRGYLEWMLLNVSDLDEDLRYSIDYYLRGN